MTNHNIVLSKGMFDQLKVIFEKNYLMDFAEATVLKPFTESLQRLKLIKAEKSDSSHHYKQFKWVITDLGKEVYHENKERFNSIKELVAKNKRQKEENIKKEIKASQVKSYLAKFKK